MRFEEKVNLFIEYGFLIDTKESLDKILESQEDKPIDYNIMKNIENSINKLSIAIPKRIQEIKQTINSDNNFIRDVVLFGTDNDCKNELMKSEKNAD